MRKRLLTLLLCLPLTVALAADHEGEGTAIEYLPVPGNPGDLPFSDAVRVGDMVFFSGKIGNLPGSRELAPGGIAGQTRQTLDNLKAAADRAGVSMDRMIKCTVFLADMADWPAMNEVYTTYFTNKPARSALGASGLALGALVEIECIGVAGDGERDADSSE